MATTSCEAFSCRIDGVFDLIEDEKFDFDVPLSPPECDMYIRETSNDLEDEDEVFFGPIGHKERCVTVNSDLQDDENFKPMSPLNGEQIAELFKEATAVSIFLKSSSTHQCIDDDENNIFDKENNGICNILSQTFNVTDNSPDLVKESDLKITKSVSSPESVSEENISAQGENSDVIIPTTPKRVLKEKNSEDQTITMQFPSPFIGRKARPRQNASKYANSKLPKTDMTLKTRSCFNSPIKVEHAYGVLKTLKPAEEKAIKGNDNTTSSVKPRGTRINNTQNSGKGDSSFTESSSKLPVPSQSGIRPPGFGVQPRRRRTSSTSSSSTSSAVADLNDTFTVSKGLPTDISALPSVCPRKVPATKACLKPVSGTSGVPKTKFTKPQGRPQPVKALPQPGTSNKKAPPTPKSLGSTPGRSKSSLTSNQQLDRSQTPISVKRSKSFTTPNAAGTKSTISTGQSVKGSQTPSKRKSEIIVTPRTRGSTTATPRNSQPPVPTPVKRRGTAVEAGVSKVQTKAKDHRPSTPANSYVSSSTETPPNPVPCKVTKRTSRSANAQKRRSFLPTPLRSDRITRSQSLRSRPGSSNTDNAPLPFNISPSAELVKPRRPAVQAPADHNLESLRSNSRLSDPFSPASQMTIVDPVQHSTGPIGGDAVVRNLIEWSPALPKEGTLIDI